VVVITKGRWFLVSSLLATVAYYGIHNANKFNKSGAPLGGLGRGVGGLERGAWQGVKGRARTLVER